MKRLGLVALGLVVGCHDDGNRGSDMALVPDMSVNPDQVKLETCTSPFSGGCAKFDVPLDWSQPSGDRISLYVDQIASSTRPIGQVWLLQGGPGGSGSDLVQLGLQIAGELDVEVYTLDHRGVGLSSRLGCAEEKGLGADGGFTDEQIFLKACLASIKAEWGDGLAQFNTSNAARDLKYAIDRFRKSNVPVYIYGVSYGTYWAQRYAAIFPDGADGIVLDSIVPMDGQYLSQFDLQGDKIGKALAEICKTDATCSDRLGADPWARLQSIAKIGSGHCPAFPFPREMRSLITAFLQGWYTRTFAFAALYRYERCNEEDVAALQVLVSREGIFDLPVGLFSPMLYDNIAFSELWETPPPSVSELDQRYDSAVFPAGVVYQEPVRALWPTYTPDQYLHKFATTSMPMLMMNGTLDQQTPIETASLVKAHYAGPNQTFVTIPYADHGVVYQSPEKVNDPVEIPDQCGWEIMKSFLEHPKEAPDTSCLDRLQPVSFANADNSADYLFGTSNLWSGAPTHSRDELAKMPIPPALKNLRRRPHF